MKPPNCSICGKRIEDYDGNLLYFKETEYVKEWNEYMKKEGKVEHPINAEWFCDKHIGKAKEVINLPITEAMKIIEAHYGK